LLDKAIDDEDYEKAARIRDEINKRNWFQSPEFTSGLFSCWGLAYF
jgi:hypothetical protein